MKISAFIKITDLDRHGKPFGTPVEREANSFVINFCNMLYCAVSQVALAGCIDATDVSRTPSTGGFDCRGPVGNDSYGIQVGTGTDAVAIGDTKLKTKILQSTTGESLKMRYSVMTFDVPQTIANVRSFAMSRTFTNESGSTINIGEIGIVALNENGFKFLIDHTLSTKQVLNGNGTTVQYTISIAV
jgi:hypothetical protein